LKPQEPEKVARKYKIVGHVQGVGFRAFARHSARGLGLRGWTRNLADGSVEVFASGTLEQLSEFSGLLRKGPHLSEVRQVDEKEAALEQWTDFVIR
jgi:acylphosphatase